MEESGNSLTSGPDGSKRRVSYFYDSDIGNYYYSQGHPMKPHRIRMAHSLIVHYALDEKMDVCRPNLLQSRELRVFHADDYISFLQSVTPETQHEQLRQLKRFNVGEDCPVFDGLYNFCQTYAGGSVGAAIKLNNKEADIAINWSGGLHHAKKCEASGFCYVNDIVLAILELLKVHQVCTLLPFMALVSFPFQGAAHWFLVTDYSLQVMIGIMEQSFTMSAFTQVDLTFCCIFVVDF